MAQFSPPDQQRSTSETKTGGIPRYVELLVYLEMIGDAKGYHLRLRGHGANAPVGTPVRGKAAIAAANCNAPPTLYPEINISPNPFSFGRIQLRNKLS
jgi:hypothetical protein